jgi:hypothetical protein
VSENPYSVSWNDLHCFVSYSVREVTVVAQACSMADTFLATPIIVTDAYSWSVDSSYSTRSMCFYTTLRASCVSLIPWLFVFT